MIHVSSIHNILLDRHRHRWRLRLKIETDKWKWCDISYEVIDIWQNAFSIFTICFKKSQRMPKCLFFPLPSQVHSYRRKILMCVKNTFIFALGKRQVAILQMPTLGECHWVISYFKSRRISISMKISWAIDVKARKWAFSRNDNDHKNRSFKHVKWDILKLRQMRIKTSK